MSHNGFRDFVHNPVAVQYLTILGIAAILFGATAVIVALQDALNRIWGVKTKSVNILKRFFKKRLVSFLVLLAAGILLFCATVVSAALSFANSYFRNMFPGTAFLEVTHLLLSVGLVAALFGTIFKVLPDVKIAWTHLWIGSLVTSILFNLGKMLIGFYIARSTVKSVYGAAGSFAVFLVWIYYSAMVFFIGAEFTKVYARKRGDPILPDENAVAYKIETYGKNGEKD